MHRHPLRQALRLPQAALKRLVTGLLQLVLLANRPARLARSGFVLPTTVLLTLMVVLTATALTYRSFTRSDMAISQREQQVIANAATPAIDRAKAKIEFLFRNDPRFPSGVPASDILADLMATRHGTNTFVGSTGRISPLGSGPTLDPSSPYTLPDETRVDINNDNKLDNAWRFRADINGDGIVGDGIVAPEEMIIYSILVDDEATVPGSTTVKKIDDVVDRNKALALVTRTGPLATTEATPACAGALAESGWQIVDQGNNSVLQKNFQVNAFVANANAANRTFETLEFQQSRTASRANRWGAWFRYDMGIFPGEPFNWNGAMHTDGSFFANRANFRAHMISSPSSCLYTQEASTITVGEVDLDGDDIGTPGKLVGSQREFQGQIVRASLAKNVYDDGDTPEIHYWKGAGVAPELDKKLTHLTDTANEDFSHSVNSDGKPFDVAMNPLRLFTNDVAEHINPSAWARNGNWNNVLFRTSERTKNEIVGRPFVDDFFRADNRWGPKPRYDSRDTNLDVTRRAGTTIGDPISDTTVVSKLTNPDDGLDGYWERQAIRRGLRLIVGQRLELGNAYGWGQDPRLASTALPNPATEALYPSEGRPAGVNGFGGNHEYLQRKSLRDNLAAVQGMVVYHYDHPNGGNFPAACMAMTAHPGTSQSIVDSRTFENYPLLTPTTVKTDFFNGKGTNGWEFQYPTAFNTETSFATAIGSGQPLGKALRNLAYFAGDPFGGAPSFKPVQEPDASTTGDEVHPAPYLSMWGDFSPLRRIFAEYLDKSSNAFTYAQLSPADKATLHSAACTLSMLAHNVKTEVLAYESIAGDNLTDVGQLFWSFIDPGNSNNSNADLSNYVGATYRKFPTTAGSFFPGENVILTPGIAIRTNWVDPTPTGTCPSGAADAEGFQVGCDEAEYYGQFSSEDFIRAYLFNSNNNATARATAQTEVNKIRSFLGGYQILRDRALGFVRGPLPSQLTPEAIINVGWDPDELATIPNSNGQLSGKKYRSACDPNIFTGIGGSGDGKGTKKVGLAVALCSVKLDTKYPSLYYLFPIENHGYNGADSTATGGYNHTQPPTENYIDDDYVEAVSTGVDYEVVNVSAIAGVPRALADAPSTWTVPATTGTAITTANINDQAQAFSVSTPGGIGTAISVPFLDKGMFDGREQVNTRVLDIDIDAITKNRVGTGDFWLPANREKQAEGVVYAFREDAVREDEIMRPKKSAATTVDTCSTRTTIDGVDHFQIESNSDCRMRFNGLALAQDPPLSADLISLKPVDFLGDPQRRPHGFRLRTASGNPADFSGDNLGAFPAGRRVGMTFVTDNSVYILGDFNPHSKDGSVTGTQLLEEFTQTLNNQSIADAFDFTKANSFYKRTTLNLNQFANLAVDHWRPVEILSDSITVLSKSFRDGAVADTFTKEEPGSQGGADSSYMNQNRPRTNFPTLDQLVRENPASPTSPVWIDRNGTYYIAGSPAQPFYDRYTANDDWMRFNNNDDIRRRNIETADATITANNSKTYINALFVSGIVPQREAQTYGGLHNYPRLLEHWNGRDLFISGAFVQLNFSTAATGPFEHDAWEENSDGTAKYPDDTQRIGYYHPPNRRWGYDVGLLYVPPAPAARRFVSIGSPRSEYYRELPADDPYIVNLRCAKTGGNLVMPSFCPA